MQLCHLIEYNKKMFSMLYKTLDYWSGGMFNFDFLEKRQEKCLSCYILLTDQISLSLLLEIFGNMCIAISYFPGFAVKNFEINLMFLIKLFCYMTKKLRQKFSWKRK